MKRRRSVSSAVDAWCRAQVALGARSALGAQLERAGHRLPPPPRHFGSARAEASAARYVEASRPLRGVSAAGKAVLFTRWSFRKLIKVRRQLGGAERIYERTSWPPARLLAEALGIAEAEVKRLQREAEAAIVDALAGWAA